MITIFLLVALLVNSSFGISGTLGVASSVTANTDVTIDYGIGGPSLTVRVNQNAQVTLSTYVSIQTTLPDGFSALSFGAQVGFAFQVSPPTATVISATLTTPALTLAAAALLTGSVSAGCLQFDASAQAYSQVYIDSYSTLSREITITLPDTGIYLFVAVEQDVPIPTFYNQARQLGANVRTQLSYAGGFLLDVTAQSSTDVTITYYNSTPQGFNDANGYVALDAYFEINLSSSSQVDAMLNYTYDEAVLQAQGVSETALQWAFYDEQSSSWNFEGETVIDSNSRVMSKSVTHFSTWGVYASSGYVLIPSLLLAVFAFIL